MKKQLKLKLASNCSVFAKDVAHHGVTDPFSLLIISLPHEQKKSHKQGI
jgi:hypothetical protein